LLFAKETSQGRHRSIRDGFRGEVGGRRRITTSSNYFAADRLLGSHLR
jgi:hypothetical protein